MTLSLPTELIEQKNLMHSSHPWVWLLHFTDATSTVRRLARNTADVTFDGETYYATYFALEAMASSVEGNMPRVLISVANPGRVISRYIEPAIEGNDLILTKVNLNHLTSDYTDLTETFRIAGVKDDEKFVRITLGAPNLLARRFPWHELSPMCDHVFGDAACGYVGATYTDCGGTLAECDARGRLTTYGGEPGLASQYRRLV